MSILNHLNPSHRPEDSGNIPPYKTRCCMKYTVDKQCRRCPFRQIRNEADRDRIMSECWDKRRGETRWHDAQTDTDIRIEYNNQYRS